MARLGYVRHGQPGRREGRCCLIGLDDLGFELRARGEGLGNVGIRAFRVRVEDLSI